MLYYSTFFIFYLLCYLLGNSTNPKPEKMPVEAPHNGDARKFTSSAYQPDNIGCSGCENSAKNKSSTLLFEQYVEDRNRLFNAGV